MGRMRAAAGSLVFLVVAPGVVVGLVPYLLTGWDAHAWWLPVRILGAVLIALGVAVVLQGFARFVLEGIGTPAPVAPPQRLVVGGLYRYVRNPMYLAIASMLAGQALVLGRPVLLAYDAVVMAASVAFVRLYEEPNLRDRFGAEYEEYQREVPGWWPRLRR